MEENKQLYDRLIKLADLMESNCDDPQFLKELNREYKYITKILFSREKVKNKNLYSAKQIKESRQKALEQIKTYLDSEDIEKEFEDRNGDYYSNDKFIVSWVCNYNNFPHEASIDKVDSFRGTACITARRSLLSEKQLQAYSTFERALVSEGLKLCGNKIEKKEFFDKYAVAYNNRLKQQK